jgi:hypothetical protein
MFFVFRRGLIFARFASFYIIQMMVNSARWSEASAP